MKFTLIHTSDVHGVFNDKNKGYLPILNYIKSLKGNILKIDTGDVLQGSPEMTFAKNNIQSLPNPMVEVFNQIKIDYYIPGNHDFNYGVSFLENFTKNIKSQTLAANIYLPNSRPYKPYDIISIQDKTIAIIGLTNHFIPNWESKETLGDYIFEHPLSTITNILDEITERYQPNLIIVGYHGGFECDDNFNILKPNGENVGCQLLDPRINILLTSHEHRLFIKQKESTYISQPGYQGRHLIQLEVEINDTDGIVINPKIINVFHSDIKYSFLNIDQFLLKNEKYLHEVIAKNHSNHSLEIKDPILDRIKKPYLAQLINHIQIETTGAQISSCSLANEITGLPNEIKVIDVLNTYIYPNTLMLCEITGSTLMKALTENAQFFDIDQGEITISNRFLEPKKEMYQYDFYDGIHYDILVSKNGNQIRQLYLKDHLVVPNETYTIALNSYRYLGGGYPTWQKELKLIKEYQVDISEIIIEYLKKEKMIDMPYENNINVIKMDM
jgi:2',3'-cyclic-nucleotide 2'-phosphodiesterase/3'-nucleotidase